MTPPTARNFSVGCAHAGQAQNITGMCQGNTDPSEDVVCETVPSYAAFAVVEGATYALKPAGAAGTDEAACCVLSGMCMRNSVEADVQCYMPGTFLHDDPIRPGRNEATCCDAGGGTTAFAMLLVLISMYVIAFACDSFEPAADYLGTEVYKMGPGIRGASIEAVASSLPELFTTLFLLFAHQDQDGFSAGIATCAGSALFNGAVIPAICIFAVTVSPRSPVGSGVLLPADA